MDWLHAWHQQAFHITFFARTYYYRYKIAKKINRLNIVL